MKSTACLLTLILLAAPLSAQENVPFTEALDSGKALLERGDVAAAFEQFQKSVTADAGRFEGYFYLAVASYRQGNLAAAEEYATAALAKAPEAEKPKVQEMLGVIGEKRDFERLVREGDEAAAKGLRAKAAESYRRAFLLFPKQGGIGLRAATIYADNLNQLLNAAVLWQKVIATGDAESVSAARQELNRRQEPLRKLLGDHLGMMLEYKAKPQKAPLAQLEEAFPDSIELQVELAAIATEVDDVIKHLGRAAAFGLDVSAIRNREDFLWLIRHEEKGPAFRTFITDAFGADVTTAILEEATRRQLARETQDLENWADARRQGVVNGINQTLRKLNGFRYGWSWAGKKRRPVNTKTVTAEFAADSLTYDAGSRTYAFTAKEIEYSTWSESFGEFWTQKTHTKEYSGIPFATLRGTEVREVERPGFSDARLTPSLGATTLPVYLWIRFERGFRFRSYTTIENSPGLGSENPFENSYDNYAVIGFLLPQDDPTIRARLERAFNDLKTLDCASVEVLRQMRREAE